MSDLLDTIMNIEVFAFIGVLVWLYVKEETPDSGGDAGSEDRPQRRNRP